jgi:hypothetical protein
MNDGTVNDSGNSTGLEVEKGHFYRRRRSCVQRKASEAGLCVFGAFLCLFCSFGFLNAYVALITLDARRSGEGY